MQGTAPLMVFTVTYPILMHAYASLGYTDDQQCHHWRHLRTPGF